MRRITNTAVLTAFFSLLLGLSACDDEERIRAVARGCGAHIEGVARLPRQIKPDRDRYC